MNQKINEFLRNDLTIIIVLSPLIYMLERTIHIYGINVVFIIALAIACLIGFFAVWVLLSFIPRIIPFLYYAGLLCCIISLVIWLNLKELIIIYLFGISLVFVGYLITHVQKNSDIQNSNIPPYLHFQILVLMGVCLAFVISIYFWDNLLTYIIIGSETCLLFGFLIFSLKNHYIDPSDLNTTPNLFVKKGIKENLKTLLWVLLSGIVPIGFSSFLFLLFYGYLLFLPFNFTTGKLIIAFSLIILIFILIKLRTKNLD